MTSQNRTKTARRDATIIGAVLIACAVLLVTGCEKKTNGGETAANTTKTPSPGAAVASGATVSTTGTQTPAANPGPKAVPSYWFESDFDAWVGKRWNEIELFQFMRTPPSGMDSGTRYVVFYRRTCEHCEEMFNEDLVPNPDLASMVTAVEVPESEDVLTDPDGWTMPQNDCEHLELPLGANWIITTPLAVRVENGIIRCATEGEHKACLELE